LRSSKGKNEKNRETTKETILGEDREREGVKEPCTSRERERRTEGGGEIMYEVGKREKRERNKKRWDEHSLREKERDKNRINDGSDLDDRESEYELVE